MTKPYSINVYDLLTVDNVCNQILREAIKLPEVSMAHVIMDAGNVSLLHQHSKMSEIYYILEGEGILYHGSQALKVKNGAYLTIPPETSHKLRNIGKSQLEHLVFAIPPFDPTDLTLLDESSEIEPEPKPFRSDKTHIIAQDGASIYELLSEKEREIMDIGLATGSLPPKRKAIPHKHEISDEVYYVISGKGRVKVGDLDNKVKEGIVIYVPVNMVHALENTGSEELEVLCLSSPAYTDEDFILV